jgi:hypothetical protein
VIDLPLLPGVPADLIRAIYGSAPGNEIASGKFLSPESSAALVANTFGPFLNEPLTLPCPMPELVRFWPPRSVALEGLVRFPWAGGRNPCLDVLIHTDNAVIGIESKRYEPFRGKQAPQISATYWRPVWGERMRGYEAVRDGLKTGALRFRHFDAAQLIKHALGLRAEALRQHAPREAVLVYLHADPPAWPNGRMISAQERAAHRNEIKLFASYVESDEVAFLAVDYTTMLDHWHTASHNLVRDHVERVHTHLRSVWN